MERSTDNQNFINTGIVSQLVKLNEIQNFTFNDDISQVNKSIIYYRIKVIGKAGEIKYSNIIVIRLDLTQNKITVSPNPANNAISVSFNAEKNHEVLLRLINNLGEIVYVNKVMAVKGKNFITVTGLLKYSSGMYTLQVLVNEAILTEKLLLL